MPPIVVRYHRRADVVADHDPSSGALDIRPRPDSEPQGATSGWFDVLQGVCVVLYVDHSRKLRLRVGAEVVPVDETLRVRWSARDGTSTVAITGGGLDVRLSYPSGCAPTTLLTPFWEEEDDDFGLFLANVLGEPGRVARVVARHGA